MSGWEGLILSGAPFPIVDLDDLLLPSSGLLIGLPRFCERKYPKGGCRKFYENLSCQMTSPVQCPYGFTVLPFQLGERRLAMTSLVPFPRLGGAAERRRATEYPECRVDLRRISQWIADAREALEDVRERDATEVRKSLDAIHEVRKLNQVVVNVMERICTKESPGNPEGARPDLVRAWKASQLITFQMDFVDLIANPALLGRERMRPFYLYKQVDKIVRVYKPAAQERGVTLRLSGRSDSSVLLDRGTFHVLPSVLIDNAIKYAPHGSCVDVHISEGAMNNKPSIRFSVESRGPSASLQEERKLFQRRFRGERVLDRQGTGVGLYVANLIASQHQGQLSFEQNRESENLSRWEFRFEMYSLE